MTHSVTARWLREELTRLRDQRDWTREHVARLTGMSRRTMNRIENGPGFISAKSLGILMHLYELDEAAKNRLRDMQERSLIVGWWDAWHDVNIDPVYAEHCELEGLANRIDMHASTIFPGLLQSPEYTRFIIESMADFEALPTVHGARFAELRAERQRRAWDRKREVRIIIDQMIFHRTPQVLVDAQIAYITRLISGGLISVRALPSTAQLLLSSFIHFYCQERHVLCLSTHVEHHIESDRMSSAYQTGFDSVWKEALPITCLKDWTFQHDLGS